MMMSKSAGAGDEDRSCANTVNTIVTNKPSKKKIRFIMSLEGIWRRCRRKTQCKVQHGQRYLLSKVKSHAADRATWCESSHKGLLQEPSVRRESSKSDGAEAKSQRGSSLMGGEQVDGH